MQRQPTALLGCGLLALGVFAPAINVPIVGAMNYLDVGREGTPVGAITLALAVFALVAALSRLYSLLWVPGIASLGLEMWSYREMSARLAVMREVSREQDDLASGLVSVLTGSLRMEWAWPVLAAGAIALLIAAAMPGEKPSKFLSWMIDERGGQQSDAGS